LLHGVAVNRIATGSLPATAIVEYRTAALVPLPGPAEQPADDVTGLVAGNH
jgi:hypothetical protein